MNSGRSVAGFLARLPAILAVISRGIARAIWQLLERVCRAVWEAATAIGRFVAEIAQWLWTAYCKIELSLVHVLVSLVLSIWSLRLLVGLVAVAIALGYFRLWVPLVIYLVVLTVAVLLYFRMNEEDEVRAAEAQRPLKDWLTTALRWGLRAAIALVSMFAFLASGAASGPALWRAITAIQTMGPSAPSREVAFVEGARAGAASPPSRPGQPAATAAGRHIGTEGPRTAAVAEVARTVEGGILSVLIAAQTAPRTSVEMLAKQAGRDFDFSTYRTERNRKEARRLNEAAMRAFHEAGNAGLAYEMQKRALAADPLDVEVAGNLAIYAFRAGAMAEARVLSLYALALPRGPERTGRTADWSTLAAVYAATGDAVQASNALYVTLSIAPDIPKRCRAAIHAVKNTYGELMKAPTQSMFARIKDEGLSDSTECALPIEW